MNILCKLGIHKWSRTKKHFRYMIWGKERKILEKRADDLLQDGTWYFSKYCYKCRKIKKWKINVGV